MLRRIGCLMLLLIAGIVYADSTDSTAENKSVETPEQGRDERGRKKTFTITKKTQHEKIPVLSQSETVPDSFPTIIPSGSLFGVFEKEYGPFLIEGSVVVPAGEKLEFKAGSKIYIGGKYTTITVFGEFKAIGTKDNPVLIRSVKSDPNPWDWDRIYIRSKRRSIFEHCIIKHSNYGLFVENGMAEVNHCTFEKNSLHALVVKNSSVTIQNTTIENGHVLGLSCQPGATITADSLTVKNNITAIACAPQSTLKINGGHITGNATGLALYENAAVTIVDADIKGNRRGVLSTVEIPRNMSEMVFKNGVDRVVTRKSKLDELFKPPEEIKSIVLPKTKTKIKVDENFKPGFSALATPAEPTASFIGNVSLGIKYFAPTSKNGYQVDTAYDIDTISGGSGLDTYDTTTTISRAKIYQSHYVGEQSDEWYAGIQPETQIFLSGRKNRADVNLLADFYGNEWTGLYKNMFNLSINAVGHKLVFGDFYENGSEISISGRKMTGLKYQGGILEMGRGTKRINFNLAAGESEMSKDIGENEMEIYNDTVDEGSSVRQQLTYVAGISIKPTMNSSIHIKGIIARDQTAEPLFRDILSDTAAPDPIQAQTGSVGGEISLLKGTLNLGFEVNVGNVDSLEEDNNAAWFEPEIPASVQKVFNNIPESDYYSGALNAKYLINGYDLSANYTEVRPSYFSAGNPYLESDKRSASIACEKAFTENVTVDAAYDWNQSYVSNELNVAEGEPGPQFENSVSLGAKYQMGSNKPSFSLSYDMAHQMFDDVGTYTTRVDTVVDGQDSYYLLEDDDEFKAIDFKNMIGIEAKQRFKSGIDYSLKYKVAITRDLSEYLVNEEDPEIRDNQIQHRISGKFGFKIKRVFKNKTTFRIAMKEKNKDNFYGLSYKISDQANITIIPRKLSLKLKGEYSDKVDEEDEDEGVRESIETEFYAVEGELKVTLTSKLSMRILGKYEESLDENEGSAENYNAKIGGVLLTYLF